ncbi:hypothetical protein [Cohnella silvisoli]|uniref:Response regulatory domain-containing protein n=1 Tax=Cohnella silvisoli TaxID=2873699 RepID=A0ABV1KQK1_9BACL|nr:hypothetical protein [Cohnella silvisoli]MCD9024667.1 hypothetical protein [Cohnella silvisoli]
MAKWIKKLFLRRAFTRNCMLVLRETSVDVVLMDIMLSDPTGTGLDAALDIAHNYPSIKVIIVSSLDI